MAKPVNPVAIPSVRALSDWNAETPYGRLGILGTVWLHLVTKQRLFSESRSLLWRVAAAIPTARRTDHSIDELALGCLANTDVVKMLTDLGVDVEGVRKRLDERVREQANDPERNTPRSKVGDIECGPGQRALQEAGSAAVSLRWYWPSLDQRRLFAACLAKNEPSFVRDILAEHGVTRRVVLHWLADIPPPGSTSIPMGNTLEVELLNNDVATFPEVTAFLSTLLGIAQDRAVEIARTVHRSGAASLFSGDRADALELIRRGEQLLTERDVALTLTVRAGEHRSGGG